MESLDKVFVYQNALYVCDVLEEVDTGRIEVRFTDRRDQALCLNPESHKNTLEDTRDKLRKAGYIRGGGEISSGQIIERHYNPYGRTDKPARAVIIDTVTGKETAFDSDHMSDFFKACKDHETEGRPTSGQDYWTDSGTLYVVKVYKSLRTEG